MRRFSAHLVLLAALVIASNAAADDATPARTVVLDTTGSWRVFHVLAPPVVATDEGLEPVLAKNEPWFHKRTAEPPLEWRTPDFDDSAWLRGPGRIAAETSLVARLSLRGKFTVTDPERVNDLRLTLGYFGGAIVYLNGTEIVRGHIGPGEAGRNGLAEIYPESVYFKGNMGTWEWLVSERYEWEKKRVRLFTDVPLPHKLLRKGTNVVAIEIVRPAEHPSTLEVDSRGVRRGRNTRFRPNFATCSLRWVRVTAAGADPASGASGLVPNAVRPTGLQVWNSNIMATDFDQDFGDVTETLRPISIAGTKGGSFSGKVVVGCDTPIENLSAIIAPLTGPGVIGPGSVRVRWGVPWGSDVDAMWRYVYPSALLGALEEHALPTVPVSKPEFSRYYGLKVPDALTPRFGAVRSVWVTVDVPKHAPAGKYTGTLTVRAKGHKDVAVPVELTVEDWTMPETDEWVTWVELMQSVDTLSLEWDAPLWSEHHWQLIARSMDHLNRIGSRVLYVPLIAYSNLGNSETMVRWIPKPGGGYTWDFHLMDRYLDTARARMGKPKVVVLWVWDTFLYVRPDDPATREYDRPGLREAKLGERQAPYLTKGPAVTMLDPATGKIRTDYVPVFRAPESREIWKGLLDAIRARLKARGITEGIMLGTASDVVPRTETLKFFRDIAPDMPWVAQSHDVRPGFFENKGGRLGYYTTVFGGNRFPVDPSEGRSYGWRNEELHAYLLRNWGRNWDSFPVTSWRHLAEVNITGEQRGVAHLGAEFWDVLKDKRGTRRGRVYFRYPEGNWRSNDICTSLLAPGIDGPIATIRYEMMREGVQECEARIFIEKALLDKELRAKLGPELVQRAQEMLDERVRMMMMGMSNLEIDSNIGGSATNGGSSWWNSAGPEGHKWFVASGWEERTRRLFALAGEVAMKLNAN